MRTVWLVVLAIIAVSYIMITFFAKERWITPAQEFRTLLKLHSELAMAEDAYFRAHNTYADFDILIGTGIGRYRVSSRCYERYCIEVRGDDRRYSIRIFPDKTIRGSGLVSLFSDETRVTRMAYGAPFAQADSKALSQEQIRYFGPK